MSKRNDQLNFPPAELQNLSQAAAEHKNLSHSDSLRKKVSGDALTPEKADVLAAELFDEALRISDISSTFVALHLGVSESLVSKWRSPNYREQPSFAQMLRLPFSFQLGLHKALNRKHGFARAALRDLLDAVGLVSLAVNQ